MKTWYNVFKVVYDDGLVSASVINMIEEDEPPKGRYYRGPDRDIYDLWMDEEEARAVYEEARASERRMYDEKIYSQI